MVLKVESWVFSLKLIVVVFTPSYGWGALAFAAQLSFGQRMAILALLMLQSDLRMTTAANTDSIFS